MEDVLLGNSILTFAEQHMPKAMGELGRKRSSDVSSILMSMLYETRKPLSMADLWIKLEPELDHMADLSRIVQNLEAANKIQRVTTKGTTGFLPKQKAVDKSKMYVDFDLLKEREL